MARFVHLSDIHIAVDRPGWTPGDLVSKHVTGWINWNLTKRGARFADAANRIGTILERAHSEQPDAIIFSGDATALGFRQEAWAASRMLNVDSLQGFAVPGNHDHYTGAAVRRRGFETAFAPWLMGERIDNEMYPFARQIAGVWFVGVNSSVPNRGIWDASGLVGVAQLQRLDQLLATLPLGPRVLVTHYPFVTEAGVPESRHHGLRDRIELAEVVARHGISLWLCGHRHHHYQIGPTTDIPFHVVCAGSATMSGAAGYWEIILENNAFLVKRHTL